MGANVLYAIIVLGFLIFMAVIVDLCIIFGGR
jgi:hypothetical protein